VLGPAGAWWLKERIVGLPIVFSHSVRSSEARGGRAVLHVSDYDGRAMDLVTDHVIAATGYQFQLDRLPFLSEDLRSRLRHERQVPILSSSFESSVPGLYFTGLASSYAFGPAMRFLHGASYTARRISQQLAAERRPIRVLPAVWSAGAGKHQEFSGLHAPPSAENSEAGG
jgi:lysine/ornithine N-monooxygenase